MQTTVDELKSKGKTARTAARQLAKVGGGVRTQALLNIAERLESSRDEILEANRRDLENGEAKGLEPYYLEPHDARPRTTSRYRRTMSEAWPRSPTQSVRPSK